jgi:hypothetical protein
MIDLNAHAKPPWLLLPKIGIGLVAADKLRAPYPKQADFASGIHHLASQA